MAVKNYFSTVDIACLVVENLDPESAVSTVVQAFTADVTPTGDTVFSVLFDFGDGNTSPGVLGVAPSYSASNTYATAADYLVKVIATSTTGIVEELHTVITVT